MTASSMLPTPVRPFVDGVTASFQGVAKVGHMLHFFGRTLFSIPLMFRHYRREMLRLLSDISWGNGSVVVGGGTIAVAVASAGSPARWWPSRATTC
ncbi:hypothetical protein C1Y40_04706 [Mycobacterium talmoniae]|uniref:Uncharacterized protein n=1 Tax=Mycobacterium talmoniae TaxID=1858794 RepID=A0A2S8BEP3_9MYCO|nr:hypothetical protein C1Y40_04706 [Mycobacterium talmoniae]